MYCVCVLLKVGKYPRMSDYASKVVCVSAAESLLFIILVLNGPYVLFM